MMLSIPTVIQVRKGERESTEKNIFNEPEIQQQMLLLELLN